MNTNSIAPQRPDDASSGIPPKVGTSPDGVPTPAQRLRQADRDFWTYHQGLDNQTKDRCCAEYERLCSTLKQGLVPRGIGGPHDAHLFVGLLRAVKLLSPKEAWQIIEEMRD